jgi:hypothetical protein
MATKYDGEGRSTLFDYTVCGSALKQTKRQLEQWHLDGLP